MLYLATGVQPSCYQVLITLDSVVPRCSQYNQTARVSSVCEVWFELLAHSLVNCSLCLYSLLSGIQSEVSRLAVIILFQ